MTALLLMLGLVLGESTRTEVIFLSEVPAERAILLYQRVVAVQGEGTIVLGRQPNMLVVRDTPARLVRFHELLAALDRKGAAELHVYVRPLVHLLPSEAAELVGEVMDEGELRMVPDDRSRQLVVICRAKTYLQIDRLLRRHDVATPGDTRP